MKKLEIKAFLNFSFNIIISYLFANLDGKMPLYQNMELNLITNFFSLVSIFFLFTLTNSLISYDIKKIALLKFMLSKLKLI